MLWDTGNADRLAAMPERLERRRRHDHRVHEEAARRLAEGDRRRAGGHQALRHVARARRPFRQCQPVHRARRSTCSAPSTPRCSAPSRRSSASSRPTSTSCARSPAMIIDGDYDVFGDGSVTIKAAPGHTPGHQVLVVRLPKTGPVMLSGDMVHLQYSWTYRVAPSFNFDVPQSMATHRRDEGLREADRRAALDQPRPGAERQDSQGAGVRPMKETIIVLILGTATPGGGFPLYGDAFAEMVNAQEPRIRIEPRNTKGSHRERAAARRRASSTSRWSRARSPAPRSPSPARRCASSRRCIPRPACSSCAATARTARSPTCAASRWCWASHRTGAGLGPIYLPTHPSGLIFGAQYLAKSKQIRQRPVSLWRRRQQKNDRDDDRRLLRPGINLREINNRRAVCLQHARALKPGES